MSHRLLIPEAEYLWNYVPSGSESENSDSGSETSSSIKSGGLCVASGTICVQGFMWNLPFNHTREVTSPPCQVTKDGRSFFNELVPAEKASGVAFETIGVALACA